MFLYLTDEGNGYGKVSGKMNLNIYRKSSPLKSETDLCTGTIQKLKQLWTSFKCSSPEISVTDVAVIAANVWRKQITTLIKLPCMGTHQGTSRSTFIQCRDKSLQITTVDNYKYTFPTGTGTAKGNRAHCGQEET